MHTVHYDHDIHDRVVPSGAAGDCFGCVVTRPRRSRNSLQRHLTVAPARELRDELDDAKQGWREMLLITYR